MKTCFYAMALISLSCLPRPAHADLGENEAQLEKRFGKPVRVLADREQVSPAEKLLTFELPSGTLHVGLFNGMSAYEKYVFKQEIIGSDDQNVRAVLNRQAKGEGWTPFPQPELIGKNCKYIWARLGPEEQDRATAEVRTPSTNVLLLRTHEFTSLRQK